jgi:hypothetical protein
VTVVLHLALTTIILPVAPVAIALATRRRMFTGLAAIAGIVVAHVVDVGVPPLPPIDTIGWIPFAIVAMSACMLIDDRRVARAAITFAIAAIATRSIGKPVWHSALARALLVGAITAAVAAAHDHAARRTTSSAELLAFAMTMAGGAIACLFVHSALLAQVLGASAIVIGASAIAARFVTPATSIASVAAVATSTVLVYAHLYAALPTTAAMVLVGSAVAPFAAAWLPIAATWRAVVAVASAMVLAAAAAYCA